MTGNIPPGGLKGSQSQPVTPKTRTKAKMDQPCPGFRVLAAKATYLLSLASAGQSSLVTDHGDN